MTSVLPKCSECKDCDGFAPAQTEHMCKCQHERAVHIIRSVEKIALPEASESRHISIKPGVSIESAPGVSEETGTRVTTEDKKVTSLGDGKASDGNTEAGVVRVVATGMLYVGDDRFYCIYVYVL